MIVQSNRQTHFGVYLFDPSDIFKYHLDNARIFGVASIAVTYDALKYHLDNASYCTFLSSGSPIANLLTTSVGVITETVRTFRKSIS